MHAGLESALAILGVALLLDFILGEYPLYLHPVVWIGTAIKGCLRLAPQHRPGRQLVFGGILTLLLVAVSAGLALLAMYFAAAVPALEIGVGAYLLKASFALRELGAAALRVQRPLTRGDLPAAREALRSLCSRDPTHLDEEALLGATVQSLAENTSDSFTAPLFFYLFLGVPGAIGYRAINTLDAMIGYRGRYEFLGKPAARLDDLVNWIPARLTALLLLLAGALTGKSVGAGWRVLRRDGGKTPSPNGGRPMAVMAGLLGVELEKKGVYALGDPRRPLTPAIVREAWILVLLAGGLATGLCALGLWALNYLAYPLSSSLW